MWGSVNDDGGLHRSKPGASRNRGRSSGTPPGAPLRTKGPQVLRLLSEVSFREGATGVRLEITFELESFGGFSKGDGDLDLPGAELRSMRNRTRVVFAQAVLQTLCAADVVPGSVLDRFQDIDVVKGHGMPGRSSERYLGARPGPASSSGTTPGQASFYAPLRTKPGGGGGS